VWPVARPKTNPDPFGPAVAARPGVAVRPPPGAQPAGHSRRPVGRGRTIPGPFVASAGSTSPFVAANAPPPSRPARASTDHDSENATHPPEPSPGRYARGVDPASDDREDAGPPSSGAPPSRAGSGGRGSPGRDPRGR
jgi:hypothetical protein